MTPVEVAVRGAIGRRGPIPFDEVVAAALYSPDGGFYTGEGRAGRRGDFVTSAEVGPLFGTLVGRALDDWWIEAGRPDVFVVVEAGAGPGTLAASILASKPACSQALRYVLVETSPAQRAMHGSRLNLEDPMSAFPSLTEPDEDGRAPAVAPPSGPIVVSAPELPRLPGSSFVIANELLDNLPFGLAEMADDGWQEVLVGVEGDELVEVLVPLDPGRAGSLPADVAPGSRAPLQAAASSWVRDALDAAGPGGRVLAIDYAATTAELCSRPWTEWVRTYRQHQRGGHPLNELGSHDITCEVAVDQLPPPTSQRSQADWLGSLGIDELVAEGRRIWSERAAIGDLAALRARSRVNEAAALLDGAGLGAFQVLEWHP